jgi:hypothetical protein
LTNYPGATLLSRRAAMLVWLEISVADARWWNAGAIERTTVELTRSISQKMANAEKCSGVR